MNETNPYNIQICAFKLIHKGKANTYMGIHFVQDTCSSLKKLSISEQWPHQIKAKINTLVPSFCVCSLLGFCALIYLRSATARDICKGNSQPPEICSSFRERIYLLRIYLDISVSFGFNTLHTIFFPFREYI